MAQLTEDEIMAQITDEDIKKFMSKTKPAMSIKEMFPEYIPESTTDLIFMQVCKKLQKDSEK